MRCLFVAEGSSDAGIGDHIERVAAAEGVPLTLSVPDFELLEERVGSSIEAKLGAAAKLGGVYDLIAVHRDADRAGRDARVSEIQRAVDKCMPGKPVVAVIPVRMTEAWLLLDEGAIRAVAGNPNGRVRLDLPKISEAERMADPKARLKEVLAVAADVSGRRLRTFNGRYDRHRAQLLELLDVDGAVRQLSSWQTFVDDVAAAVRGELSGS